MARIGKRGRKTAATIQKTHEESNNKQLKRKRVTRKRKPYKSREVSPTRRPKYGCGRLHWNMRNHGKIDIRRSRRKRVPISKGASSKVCEESEAKYIPAEIADIEQVFLPVTEVIQTTSTAEDKVMEISLAGSKVGTRCCSCDRPTTATVDSGPLRSAWRETAESSIQVSTHTENKQVSAHLIYDDDDDDAMSSSQQQVLPTAEPDDSLVDVTNVPENETLLPEVIAPVSLPPLFPWENTNNNNNNNQSVSYMKSNYSRGGGLPLRRCAMYATIRIHLFYKPTRKSSRGS